MEDDDGYLELDEHGNPLQGDVVADLDTGDAGRCPLDLVLLSSFAACI